MTPRRLPPAPALALALSLVAAALSPSLPGPFLWDDGLVVDGVSALARAGFGHVLTTPFPLGGGAYYRPLTAASYALDLRLFGPSPLGFRLTNLLLHLLNVALVFALARRLGAGAGGAALAGALFGLFPRLTEASCWISGRADLLAAAGALAALLARCAGRSGLSLLLSGAALLGKETGGAALPALAAFELAALQDGASGKSRAIRRLLALGGLAAGYVLLRAAIPGHSRYGDALPPLRRLGLVFQSAGTYVAMAATPLSPQLGIGEKFRFELFPALLGLLAILAAVVLLWRARRWPAGLFPAAVLGLAALLPVLHLLPLPITGVAADRYLYLPLASAAAVLAARAALLPRTVGRTAGALASLLLAVFGVATWRRAAEWGDAVAFWAAGMREKGTDLTVARTEMARILFEHGRYAESARLYGQALAAPMPPGLLTEADTVQLFAAQALAIAEAGDERRAAAMLEELARRAPEDPAVRKLLAAVRLRAEGSAPGEPEGADARLAWAGRLARLGRRPGEAAWLAVSRANGASPRECLAAAAYLLREGTFDAAEEAVGRLAGAGVPAAARGPLEEELADRRSRERRLDAAIRDLGLSGGADRR